MDGRRFRNGGWSAVGLLGAAALVAGHGSGVAQGDAGPRDPAIERGRAVVVGAPDLGPGKACFSCHGLDGKGDAAAAFPRLSGQYPHYLRESLKNYANGKRQNQIMTPIAQALSDEQIRDVALYYASRPMTQAVTQAVFGAAEKPELVQAGALIAARGAPGATVQGCINCHGPEGAGLPPHYPYLAGQYASYIEAQLQAWRSGARSGGELDIMKHIATQLSERDVHAVAAYYGSLKPRSLKQTEPAAVGDAKENRVQP